MTNCAAVNCATVYSSAVYCVAEVYATVNWTTMERNIHRRASDDD